MASSTEKRERSDELLDSDFPVVKKVRLSPCNDQEDVKLSKFLKWCSDGGLILSQKVCVSRQGSCAQYGMIAVEDIKEGEVLFEIPRSLTLHPQTSAIAQLLQQEQASLTSSSGWVELLIALMYEYTSNTSHWSPYIHLVPDYDVLDLPMFWSRDDRERELIGTGLVESVERDLLSLTKEFNDVVLPFIKKHPDVFGPQCEDIALYKKMVGFVMAYSFTDPAPAQNDDDDSDNDDDDDENDDKRAPMMVPMADILNHVSANNAHMMFGETSLKMVAKCDIKKGHEVYNTYGCNSNSALLQMYGFAEKYPLNRYDTVDIPMSELFEVCRTDAEISSQIKDFDRKCKHLNDLGLSDDYKLVLGVDGVLTEEEAVQIFKVLLMSEEEFNVHVQNEGWMEEEEDGELSLRFDKLAAAPSLWKKILMRPKGRPNLTWEAVGRRDMKKNDTEEEEYVDRKRWRRDVAMFDETRLPRKWGEMAIKRVTQNLLSHFPHSMQQEEELQLSHTAASPDLIGAAVPSITSAEQLQTNRKQYCSYVRHGQMKLLEQLHSCCLN